MNVFCKNLFRSIIDLKSNCARKILSVVVSVSWGVAACAQEVTPPKLDGANFDFIMARLSSACRRIAVAEEIPYDSISPRIGIGFRVETDGAVTCWRMLDNTCTGRDSCGVAPATETTQRLLRRAFDSLQGAWSPALRDGKPIAYDMRCVVRIPVGDIERKQNPDPLLFLGEDPAKSFHPWARVRIRHDGRFVGREGVTCVRFYIEADGRITIDEVLSTPNERQAKEIVRVILRSRRKWTPRKVHGVPQRTEYVYCCNLVE